MIKPTNLYSKLRLIAAITVFSLVCLACTSSGPATTYYVLGSELKNSSLNAKKEIPSIGVGPVVLPAYLENTAIVSKASSAGLNSTVLNVSGYHAWSEPLDGAIARVVAQVISSDLGHDDVWAFPWDTRNRPGQQINITFEQLDGVRGERVDLRAKWFVYDSAENKTISSGSFSTSLETSSSSYASYVEALQKALDTFALELAAEFKN